MKIYFAFIYVKEEFGFFSTKKDAQLRQGYRLARQPQDPME